VGVLFRWVFFRNDFLCKLSLLCINIFDLLKSGLRSRHCIPFATTWFSPRFGGVHVVHLFINVLCCVVLSFEFCLSSSCVLCAQSLDCSFLIAPSCIENHYEKKPNGIRHPQYYSHMQDMFDTTIRKQTQIT
jgi:hypothetical protein